MTDTDFDTIRHDYEHRAAVYEYDGGLSRMKAESLALRDISTRHGATVAKRVRDESRASA